ncbi:MAG: hypothetical protein L3J32_02105 [Rhizobiaceae bacterium]|nr:hypothetical protein [Rhizobiaceae bacterium]
MSKNLRERAEITALELQEILGAANGAKSGEIADAIEQAIIKALVEERQRCAEVARGYYADDSDKGDAIADEISRVRSVLITNLSAMR